MGISIGNTIPFHDYMAVKIICTYCMFLTSSIASSGLSIICSQRDHTQGDGNGGSQPLICTNQTALGGQLIDGSEKNIIQGHNNDSNNQLYY